MAPEPRALAALDELGSSSADPKAVAAIRHIAVEGTDFDAYKVNAFRIAREIGAPRRETLRAFLFATRLGIFDLNWDIYCPACKGIPAYERHLMGLRNTAHCGLCELRWDLDFEEQVEVTFTVNPSIRRIQYVDFKDRDFRGRMEYFNEILPREGRDFVVGECIEQGQTRTFFGDFAPGDYRYYLPPHMDKGGRLTATGTRAQSDQVTTLRFDARGNADVKRLLLQPGRVGFRVTSAYPGVNGFLVRPIAPETNWVSAAYVTNLQDFRDLFAGEFLAPDVSFALRNLTLMFTDIKGSTEMYERVGDSSAYSRVREHFRVMTEAIRSHDGCIVKTIGDSVMASFPVNADALAAALDIQEAFVRPIEALGGIEVKIGLHRGPAIAVTSNRCLDYFGRTVNVAARVQDQSRAREVLMTEAVHSDPAAQEILAGRGRAATSSLVRVKGVTQDVRVYTVRVG